MMTNKFIINSHLLWISKFITLQLIKNSNTCIHITSIGVMSFLNCDLNIYLTNKLLRYLSSIIISNTAQFSMNIVISESNRKMIIISDNDTKSRTLIV